MLIAIVACGVIFLCILIAIVGVAVKNKKGGDGGGMVVGASTSRPSPSPPLPSHFFTLTFIPRLSTPTSLAVLPLVHRRSSYRQQRRSSQLNHEP